MEPNPPNHPVLISQNPPQENVGGLNAFQPMPEDIIGPEFNPPYRFIFGNQAFSDKELNHLRDLKESDLYPTLDPSYWNDAMLLRYIQGCGYDVNVAKTAIEAHDEWRNQNIRLTIDDGALTLLVF